MSFIIGCDADGVLTDLSAYNLREGRRHFRRNPVNPNAYLLDEIFDLHDMPRFIQIIKAFRIYINYCKNELPRADVSNVIQELSGNGLTFHCISARKFASEKNCFGSLARKWFEKWINKHKIAFKTIQYCSENNSQEDKLLSCRKLHVDVMIEDKSDNALFLAQNGVLVILMDAPYNKNIEHENIHRITDWKEIRDVLLSMQLSKASPCLFVKKEPDEIQKLTCDEKRSYFESYYHNLCSSPIDKNALIKGDRLFRILYFIMSIPMKCYYRVKVFNRDNLPYQDGFIIASNHCDSSDQYKLGIALGNRPFIGFAAKEIQNTFRGKMFDATGLGLFIDRKDADNKKKASEKMATYIAHGRTALIFPEGTRKNKTPEGRNIFQNPFKLGAVSLAQKTGTGILPVAVNAFGRKVFVRFGELQYVLPNDDIKRANQKLARTVADLSLENIIQRKKGAFDSSEIQKKYHAYIETLEDES